MPAPILDLDDGGDPPRPNGVHPYENHAAIPARSPGEPDHAATSPRTHLPHPATEAPAWPELSSLSVSLSPHAQATDCRDVRLSVLFERIQSGYWRKQVSHVREAFAQGGKDAAAEPKRRLPGILFSGLFSRRAASALTQHSGLICVDLDNLGDQLESIRDLIVADPHTLAAFTSPTGTGLKVVFRCDPNRAHMASYRAAERYVLEHFGLEIDQACKDVSRLCFVSHDPELFLARGAVELPYPEEPAPFRAPQESLPGHALTTGTTPGDDYDQRHDIPSLLLRHGWSKVGQYAWRRPGKSHGVSATFNHIPNRLYVFTSSTGFEPNHVYRPWHVYALLEHGGDFSAAARALAGQGYGERLSPPQPTPEIPPIPAAPDRRPLSAFPLPPDDDANTLLGNRYLCRGDGAILSGTSGMGKSSLSLQLAILWALGRPAFGITPRTPLKSLIIQSEDSDGDVGEVWASIRHALGLSPTELDQINTQVLIVSDRTSRGATFHRTLQSHLSAVQPDLVWINPLQAFMDGDITQSQDLGRFLRESLNSLNPCKFAYILVHHTTKPATGKDRTERLWHEVMYDMAGGAELINWARAILSLRPAASPGEFNLVLAKRGRRAGLTRRIDDGLNSRTEPQTVIPLRHSTGRVPTPGGSMPAIFWEPREADETPAPSPPKTGRPTKYDFSDYRSLFPAKSSPGLPVAQLHRQLIQNGQIEKKNFHNVLKRWAEEGHIEAIDEHGQPRRFRAAFELGT